MVFLGLPGHRRGSTGQSRPDQTAILSRSNGHTSSTRAAAHLNRLAAELADYFAGRLTEFRTPLVMDGTDWQRKVWLVTVIGVPVCIVLLFFAPLFSIWLAVAITGLMGVFVILGLIVLWRRLFVKSGILRRSRFNDGGDQR